MVPAAFPTLSSAGSRIIVDPMEVRAAAFGALFRPACSKGFFPYVFAGGAPEGSLGGHFYIASFNMKKLSVHRNIGDLPMCGTDNPPEGLP